MSARKALGKGLGALIPGADSASVGRELSRVSGVPIERIIPNPRQPRLSFDDKAIEGLAESIREQGVLEPLIVRPATTPDAEFELVAGERRWRAAQKAGLDRVPVIVKELSDNDALLISLTENIQRQELNPIEEARAYQMLKDEFGMTQEDISKRVGVERSTVANSVRLLKLPESVQEDIVRGTVSAGHARVLLSVDDALREPLWREIIDKGLTVRQTELLSQKPKFKTVTRAVKERAAFNAALDEMTERLSRALGSKVRIRMSSRGGAIEIRFVNREELEALFDRLLGE